MCVQALLNLEHTYWKTLHLSNQWLYISTKYEVFTVLCGSRKFEFKLQNRGKLYLSPRYRGYSTHSTFYTLSTLTRKSSQEDVLHLAPVDYISVKLSMKGSNYMNYHCKSHIQIFCHLLRT
jgi:hypothetical protein